MSASVTVDGVMIPCSKVTWTITSDDGISRCTLELPRVAISAEAAEVVARYVEPSESTPHTCNCGRTPVPDQERQERCEECGVWTRSA